jgi:hypothetical protein
MVEIICIGTAIKIKKKLADGTSPFSVAVWLLRSNVSVQFHIHWHKSKKKLISVALVPERTIPAERLLLVGEVSANVCGQWVSCGQRNGSPRPYFQFSRSEPCFFFQVAPQLYLWGWVDPDPDPLLLRKSGSARNRTRNLWICSQELWPLEHRGSLYVHWHTLTNYLWL